MRVLILSAIVAAAMAVSSVAGVAARPTKKAQESGQKFLLENIVPKQFGDWRELHEVVQIVNPQTKELLDKLYSQTLTRSYINSAGYRIMLSLAYGDDQRGGLGLHKPEVCYPAQGFTVLSNEQVAIRTTFGEIPGRRLNTRIGKRTEPVTYWFNVGNSAIESKFQQRMVEIRLGLSGQIPDGLLFRVSSIDPEADAAFKVQERFVSDLLQSVDERDRVRLSGIGKTS